MPIVCLCLLVTVCIHTQTPDLLWSRLLHAVHLLRRWQVMLLHSRMFGFSSHPGLRMFGHFSSKYSNLLRSYLYSITISPSCPRRCSHHSHPPAHAPAALPPLAHPPPALSLPRNPSVAAVKDILVYSHHSV